MTASLGQMRQYKPPREGKTPPHVSLRVLRSVAGLTLEDVAERVATHFPEMNLSRGTLSAIEGGGRGASPLMLRALEMAYGIPEGSLTTAYEPHGRVA
jgi:transcriptional regulator with XRE-family HTH domain